MIGMAAPSFAQDAVRISATRRTLATRRTEGPTAFGGTSRTNETDVCYRFEIRRVRLNIPEDLRIRHMTVIRAPDGALRAAALKEEEFVLAGPVAALVDTEPVTLRDIEWRGARGIGPVGRLETKLVGWHVTILDSSGAVLFARGQPREVEEQAETLKREWDEAQSRPPWPPRWPPQRPIQPRGEGNRPRP